MRVLMVDGLDRGDEHIRRTVAEGVHADLHSLLIAFAQALGDGLLTLGLSRTKAA